MMSFDLVIHAGDCEIRPVFNHPRWLTCSFLQESQTNYTFLQLTKLEKSPTPNLATQKTSYT